MGAWNPGAGAPEANRRRSQRVIVSVAVVVKHAPGDQGQPFEEETQTLAVNAHGAMITMATKVTKNQVLVIGNLKTKEEVGCRVVYLGPATGNKTQVAIEFTTPSPTFWRIAFPPDDWGSPDVNPATRNKK